MYDRVMERDQRDLLGEADGPANDSAGHWAGLKHWRMTNFALVCYICTW